jgi:hypothetical protein
MLNLTSLNQRVNYLTGKINSIPNPPVADTLSAVLNAGNSAGAKDINMNNNDILQVDNINLTTINGSAYPPVVASDTLQQVVNAGNGISNFAVGNNADIISTNFTNNRQLLLNANADPTIKMIDNLNASHFTTFDIDTINLDGTTTTWADIVSGASSSNTLQEVLDAGNTANLQTLTLNNTTNQSGTAISGVSSYLQSFQNFIPSVSPFTSASSTTSVEKQAVREQLYIADGALNIYHDARLEINGDPSVNAVALNAQMVLRDDNTITSTKSVTTTYRTDGITQVNTGGTTSNYTISTDKVLQLGGTNIEVNASSIKFGDIASQFTTQTNNGFNANDNASSAFAFYRNNQFSLFGTGNTNLLANKNYLQFTDVAGTGTANLSSSTLTMVSPTTGVSLYNSGSARISSANSTGASTPLFTLENSTAGASAGVAMETYKNQATAGTAGDEVFRLSMFGKNSGNTKEEYGRITCNIRDPNPTTAGADGSIQLAVPVGDTMTTFLDLNGNSNRVNCLRQLNIQNNDIISSGGDIHLNASGSSGTGAINLQAKNASGGDLILNGTQLTAVSAGGGAGLHLRIKINGVFYKIQLLND